MAKGTCSFLSFNRQRRLGSFQIKNAMTMASAIATHQDRRLSRPRLEAAIMMREEFIAARRNPVQRQLGYHASSWAGILPKARGGYPIRSPPAASTIDGVRPTASVTRSIPGGIHNWRHPRLTTSTITVGSRPKQIHHDRIRGVETVQHNCFSEHPTT
jgi:hypothetical protein